MLYNTPGVLGMSMLGVFVCMHALCVVTRVGKVEPGMTRCVTFRHSVRVFMAGESCDFEPGDGISVALGRFMTHIAPQHCAAERIHATDG